MLLMLLLLYLSMYIYILRIYTYLSVVQDMAELYNDFKEFRRNFVKKLVKGQKELLSNRIFANEYRNFIKNILIN